MEQHRVNERISLMRIEVMPAEITWWEEFFELFKTVLMTSLVIEEVVSTTSSVHMIPLNKYVGVLTPVTVVLLLTALKSSAFAAEKWIKDHEILTEDEQKKIETRLNSILEWINWLDDLFANFLLAYLFGIWLLANFYPGKHEHAEVEVLILYYVGVVHGAVVFSVFQAILAFQVITQNLTRLAQDIFSSLTRNVGYLIGYDLKFLLGNFATLGAIDQLVGLVYLSRNEEDVYQDFTYEHAFPLFYTRTAVAVLFAFYPSCQLIYEFAKNIDHTTSASYLKKLGKVALGTFSVALIDIIVRAIHDNDIFTYGMYFAMLAVVPILVILNRASCYQQLAYKMVKPVSISESRYIIYTTTPTTYQSTGETTPEIKESGSFSDFDVQVLQDEQTALSQLRQRPSSAQNISRSMSNILQQGTDTTNNNNNLISKKT